MGAFGEASTGRVCNAKGDQEGGAQGVCASCVSCQAPATATVLMQQADPDWGRAPQRQSSWHIARALLVDGVRQS